MCRWFLFLKNKSLAKIAGIFDNSKQARLPQSNVAAALFIKINVESNYLLTTIRRAMI
jgi:hypothetical protein